MDYIQFLTSIIQRHYSVFGKTKILYISNRSVPEHVSTIVQCFWLYKITAIVQAVIFLSGSDEFFVACNF